jgi:hypothetical protein
MAESDKEVFISPSRVEFCPCPAVRAAGEIQQRDTDINRATGKIQFTTDFGRAHNARWLEAGREKGGGETGRERDRIGDFKSQI